MSWESFLGPALSVAAIAAPAVANLVGTSIQTGAAQDAAAQNAAGLQKGADLLSTGYDAARDAQNSAIGNVRTDQATGFNTVAPLIQAVPGAYTDALTKAATGYGTTLGAGADTFGTTLGSGAGNFATNLAGNASSYGGDLTKGASSYGSDVGKAATGYSGNLTGLAGDIYTPFTAAGKQALSVLQGISGTNPASLTPAQQLAMDNFTRQAQDSLAASGLRGSGRAATAALSTGLANLTAQDTAQNQARIDNATNSLLSAGELGSNQTFAAGSAGQGAQLTAAQQAALQNLQAVQSGAGARLNAGTAGAQAGLNANNAGAQARLTANNAGGQALLNAGNTGAASGVTAAQNLINATNTYMGQRAGTDFAQGQVDTNAVMGKANAQAGAAQGTAATNAAVTAANGANWGGAIGTLGGIINANNKSLAFPTGNPIASGAGANATGNASDSVPYDPANYGPMKDGGLIADKARHAAALKNLQIIDGNRRMAA